jgi:hypothetical protein
VLGNPLGIAPAAITALVTLNEFAKLVGLWSGK